MAVFLDAADVYVSLGFRVFPLGHGSKLPAIKGGNGFKDATDNPEQIDAWAKAYPNCNVAIATGEPSMIVVLDVDTRNGGFDTLSKLASGGFLFPPCPTAKTGNNGRHMYFRQPPGLKSSKDRLGPGIDVKSTGGYVVAAPSWIAPTNAGRGGSYQWLASPEATLIPPLPSWAIERLMPKTRPPQVFETLRSPLAVARRLDGLARFVAGAPNGNRNAALNWASFKAAELVGQNQIGAFEVVGILRTAALNAGLDAREISATIESGLRAGIEKGRAANV